MARIICGYCGRNHPATYLCTPAEKNGFLKQKLRSGEQRLPEKGEEINKNQPQQFSEPEKTAKRSENNSQRQQYDPNAAERVKRWRENNPERHRERRREYQREYMRQYRQRKKVDNDSQTD